MSDPIPNQPSTSRSQSISCRIEPSFLSMSSLADTLQSARPDSQSFKPIDGATTSGKNKRRRAKHKKSDFQEKQPNNSASVSSEKHHQLAPLKQSLLKIPGDHFDQPHIDEVKNIFTKVNKKRSIENSPEIKNSNDFVNHFLKIFSHHHYQSKKKSEYTTIQASLISVEQEAGLILILENLDVLKHILQSADRKQLAGYYKLINDAVRFGRPLLVTKKVIENFMELDKQGFFKPVLHLTAKTNLLKKWAPTKSFIANEITAQNVNGQMLFYNASQYFVDLVSIKNKEIEKKFRESLQTLPEEKDDTAVFDNLQSVFKILNRGPAEAPSISSGAVSLKDDPSRRGYLQALAVLRITQPDLVFFVYGSIWDKSSKHRPLHKALERLSVSNPPAYRKIDKLLKQANEVFEISAEFKKAVLLGTITSKRIAGRRC